MHIYWFFIFFFTTGNFHLTSQITIVFNMQKDLQVQFFQEVLMTCFEVLLFFCIDVVSWNFPDLVLELNINLKLFGTNRKMGRMSSYKDSELTHNPTTTVNEAKRSLAKQPWFKFVLFQRWKYFFLTC
jgi:hypothetical protein